MKALSNIKKIQEVVLIGIASFTLQECQEAARKGDGSLMTRTSSDRLVKFVINGFPSTYAVSATSTSRAESDIQVNLAVDASLVDIYDEEMETNYYPIPDKPCTPENPEVTASAGRAISSAASLSIASDSEFVPGCIYLIPVTIESVTGDLDIVEAGHTIFLKVFRTLRSHAPYVGQASIAYQLLLPEPIPSLPAYTWEMKIYATQSRSSGASSTTRVRSFGGNESLVEGGAVDDGGFKRDQNLLHFGENTDKPNQLHVTTKRGKMSLDTHFVSNAQYAVASVNDGNTLILYINGERDNSMTVVPYEYALYGVQIGMPSKGYQPSQSFYGRLSEIHLWTRPLSTREVKANVCGVDPFTNGLVSYWGMSEGEGTTFYDLSPSKHDISHKNGVMIDWTHDDTNKCLE